MSAPNSDYAFRGALFVLIFITAFVIGLMGGLGLAPEPQRIVLSPEPTVAALLRERAVRSGAECNYALTDQNAELLSCQWPAPTVSSPDDMPWDE